LVSAYRETITRSAEVDYAHKKLGPPAEFARVKLRLEPLAQALGFEFVLDASENEVPTQWRDSVKKGVIDAAKKGILNGGEVVGCRVTFFGGTYHPEDSNDKTFYMAAREAFWLGMQKAVSKLVI